VPAAHPARAAAGTVRLLPAPLYNTDHGNAPLRAPPLSAMTSATPTTAATQMPEVRRSASGFWTSGIVALAVMKFGMHVAAVVVTPYGVHRDEFLYVAMGRYLQLFRMDFPPFIALLANTSRILFGDTLVALRIAPALAGGALVLLAALIARELGGGRGAQGLAALAVVAAPLFMRAASLFQPVVFDQLWWTLALYALVRIARHGAPRDWLLLAVAGGIGLLSKFSIGFIAVGVLVALVATRERRWWRTRWPYITAVIALVIGSPSIVGQIALGFPVLGQMSDLQAQQLARVTPAMFLTGQILMIGPAIMLAVGGAIYALVVRAEAADAARPAVVACLAAVVLLMVAQGKEYYAGPVYPLLFAVGAVGLEAVSSGTRRGLGARRVVTGVLVILMVSFGALALPLGLPILPPQQLAGYAAWLGLTRAVETNRGDVLPLPQDFADMLGWEEQVAAVATAYHALPESERRIAVVLASNYGEAGALDWFGPRYGLPRAVSDAGSYWFFGPGDMPGYVAVGLGIEPRNLEAFYEEVTVIGRVPNPWGVPEQQDNPVIVARRPARTLQQVWPELAGRN
jgi:4-amino-4-deoxy-L-arabinose transferase-like glycosyltransferase